MVRAEMTSKGGRQPGAGLAWWAGPKGKKGEEEKEGQKGSPGPDKNFRFSQFTDLGKDRKEKERGKEKRVRFEK